MISPYAVPEMVRIPCLRTACDDIPTHMGSTWGLGDAYGSADKLLHIPEKPVQFLQSLNIGIQ